MGLFYRTIRIVENGIKPAYVFDGKPPELKSGVVRRMRPLFFRTVSTLAFTFCSSLSGLRGALRLRRKAKKLRKLARHHHQQTTPVSHTKTGTAEDVDRFSRRTVKVTKEHNEECRKLLRLMGIPVVVVRRV